MGAPARSPPGRSARIGVARRPFATGLLLPGWRIEDLVLIAVGTASILFDGLSQTQPWFDVFGAPAVPTKTLQLAGFLGLIVVAVIMVALTTLTLWSLGQALVVQAPAAVSADPVSATVAPRSGRSA